MDEASTPTEKVVTDFDLPEPPADMLLRPVQPVEWSAVEEHFRPWVQMWQERPESEADRLRRKVDAPFEM